MSETEEGARADFGMLPHLQDPSGAVGVWFTEPPGAVIRFVRRAEGTVPLVEWLVAAIRTELLLRFPSGPLVLVLDLGLMYGRDPVARPIVAAAVRSFKERIVRAALVPPEAATFVYLASLRASISLMRVFGVSVSIESLPDALRSLQVGHGPVIAAMPSSASLRPEP